MLKTAWAVEKLYQESDVAQLAAAEGVLNISALARQIQPRVEDLTLKEVAIGTIATALNRLVNQTPTQPLKPEVKLTQLTLHPQVLALTYEKTLSFTKKLPEALRAFSQHHQPFFTFTQGPEEITIIADQELQSTIEQHLGHSRYLTRYLAAVSVSFSPDYLEVPNIIYTLMGSLAVKQINILEMVSTRTSLTFVVYSDQLNLTVEALKLHVPHSTELDRSPLLD